MNKPKINAAIVNKLASSDTATIVAAIQSLKNTGNKDYLPLIFDLLSTVSDVEVKKEILALLSSVKDKSSIPVFIEALKDEKYRMVRKDLLTSCWQNGMDYSAHISDFINIIVADEWELAFEAFTVIENLKYFPEAEQQKELRRTVAEALKTVDEPKRYFLEEIMGILANKKE